MRRVEPRARGRDSFGRLTLREAYAHARATGQRQPVDHLENHLFPDVLKFTTEVEIPEGLIQ